MVQQASEDGLYLLGVSSCWVNHPARFYGHPGISASQQIAAPIVRLDLPVF